MIYQRFIYVIFCTVCPAMNIYMATQKPVFRINSSLDSWRCYSSVGADNFSSSSISVLTSTTKKHTVSRLSRVIYASRMIPAPQTPEKAFWSDLKTSVYKQGFGMWVYCSGRWIRDMMKICGDPDLPRLKGKLDSFSAWSIAFSRSSLKRISICFLQRKKKIQVTQTFCLKILKVIDSPE